MSEQNLETENWHIRLLPHHYHFFKKLAEESGDIERGASARQCRKFLNEKITEHKRSQAKQNGAE